MSIEKLMKPVTILRRVESDETDEYGNAVVETVEVEGKAAIQKAHRVDEEQGSEGEVSDTRWNGCLPIGTDLNTGDALRNEGGEVFEMVGDPWNAEEGSPEMWHVEVSLRRVAGAGDKS